MLQNVDLAAHVCSPRTCGPLPPTPGPRIPDVLPPSADDDRAGQLQQIDTVLERFHYAEHGGSFRFCSGRPCREVAEIRRGPGLL